MPLLGPSQLEMSSVVANRRMNRERDLRAYRQELGCDPLAELRERGASNSVAWLDICCGTGRALVAAAKQAGPETAMAIDGIDLVDFFDPNPFTGTLELHACAFERWLPRKRYALVTCVHGLHYVGDKLAFIAKMAGCLTESGLLIANLDVASFRFHDGNSAGRQVAKWLRSNGIEYNSRRRLIRCVGPRKLVPPFRYRGADDRVGPNYTGQPAVAAIYAR